MMKKTLFPYSVVAFIKPVKKSIVQPQKLRHITVKRRFKLNKTTIRKLRQKLQATVKRYHPFVIRFGGVKYFEKDKYYVEYRLVRGDPVLQRLHQDIRGALKSAVVTRDRLFEGRNFVPHMTLRYKVRPEEILKRRNLRTATTRRRGGKISQLCLIKEIDHKKDLWRVLERYKLKR
jgi:2'-5' RNA ligase